MKKLTIVFLSFVAAASFAAPPSIKYNPFTTNNSGIVNSPVLLTNMGNTISGNGAGLTNLNRATYSTSGVRDTNDFSREQVVPTVRSGPTAQKVPMRWLSGYLAGANMQTPALLTNCLNAMQDNGLVAAGFNYVSLDAIVADFFKTTRDANGNRQWSDAWNPYMTNIQIYAHSKGIGLGGYYEPLVGADGLGYPGTVGYETNDAIFAAKWFDKMQIDAQGGHPDSKYKIQKLVALIDVYRTNGPVPVRVALPGEYAGINDSLPWNPEIMEFASSIAPGIDMSQASPWDLWQSGLTNINQMEKFSKWVHPGFFQDAVTIPWTWGFPQMSNNVAANRGYFDMACMLCADTPIPTPFINGAGADITMASNLWTDQIIRQIHQDSACIPAIKVSSNSLAEVWWKPMKGASPTKHAIALFNRSTNTVQTITAYWTNCTIPLGYYAAYSVHAHTNFTATNSISRDVAPMDCALFIVDTSASGITNDVEYVAPNAIATSFTRLTPLVESPDPTYCSDGLFNQASVVAYTSMAVKPGKTNVTIRCDLQTTNLTMVVAWTNTWANFYSDPVTGARTAVNSVAQPVYVTNGVGSFTYTFDLNNGSGIPGPLSTPYWFRIAWGASTNTGNRSILGKWTITWK